MLKHSNINHHGYWQDEKGHYFDVSLAKQLVIMFKGQSVVDFGCGLGDYVRHFRKANINCEGFDGNPLTPHLSHGVAKVLDLSCKVELLEKFDWVLSLEVGEHIPKQFESTFIDNICKHCVKGAVVSWAIPNQVGRGHFNCQSNIYIIQQMANRGFKVDLQSGSNLRDHSSRAWFKNTIMVFLR
jgi:2-polyprenyl-3-methyl-5-hydroxy-6-metoxy-1,4-benzoquinol methylase